MAEMKEEDKKLQSKLDEMSLKLKEMEVKMENQRESSEREKNHVVIQGNVGSIGSVGGENIRNVQHHQSTGGQLKTAEGGREPVIVLASDGIAAECFFFYFDSLLTFTK